MALLLTRDFWRPSPLKLAVFGLIAAFQAYAVTHTMVFDAVLMAGFPFGFYPVGTPGWFAQGPMPGASYAWLLADLACWYAIACGIDAMVRRIRAR